MLDHFGVTEETWRDAIEQDPFFAQSETPRLVGRVIAALAADPEVASRSGQVLTCWDLAREYDVRDVDGAQPHWDDHLDRAIDDILDGASPSDGDLMLLRIRRHQIDFDESRSAQRKRIVAFLERHGSDATPS